MTQLKGSQLVAAIDQTVSYLNTVREARWSRRLGELRAAVEEDPYAGAKQLLAALPEFCKLYLTMKSGHNVSERQEITSNAKLSEMRSALLRLAESQIEANA
jgi:hypothetical protein